jgi:hypothetical protein
MSNHSFTPHPREAERQVSGPSRVHDQFKGDSFIQRFNRYLAIKITSGVGTMWCAYAFAILALVSLPSVISAGSVKDLVAWIAQTFLQLVLLSIIIVGQNISQAAADKRAQDTFEDASASLDKATQIQMHLLEQDRQIESLLQEVKALRDASSR